MKFDDYTPDEREQWRKQDMSKAYLEQLKGSIGDYADFSLAAVRVGDIHGATLHLGIRSGIQFAIDIAVDP